MKKNILDFDSSFAQLLKKEAENVLGAAVVVGQKFESSDSFTYLLTAQDHQYVGKIYRFQHWPPAGKLQVIEKLLDEQDIPHEQVVHIDDEHPIFQFGWQLSHYLPGGTARELRKKGVLDPQMYFTELGKVLRQVHEIELPYYGALHNEGDHFASFNDYVMQELKEQDFNELPHKYQWALPIINEAKYFVLKNLSEIDWSNSTLVHNDVNENNVIWQATGPILIDWVDALAAPAERDFAALTFRQDSAVIRFIEQGYGKQIDLPKLKFFQVIRFIKLGRFFYFEDKDETELEKMMSRLEKLLTMEMPYGAE